MRLDSLTPNLMVENISETIEFYKTYLGFESQDTVSEAGKLIWGFIKKDNVVIMLQETKSIKEEYPVLESYQNGGALTFYIKVDNVTKLYEEILTHGEKVKIVSKLHKTPYGANEFAIMDPNKFILVFSDILE